MSCAISLNVCTFGYTTPYWDWERWEKEIDRMALYGVNMPLATVASEAIAERVWLRMGLAKEEIREVFHCPRTPSLASHGQSEQVGRSLI